MFHSSKTCSSVIVFFSCSEKQEVRGEPLGEKHKKQPAGGHMPSFSGILLVICAAYLSDYIIITLTLYSGQIVELIQDFDFISVSDTIYESL